MKFPQIAVITRPRPRETTALGNIAATLKRAGYMVRETFDLTAPEPIVFVWSWGKAMIQRMKYPDTVICCVDHGYTKDRANLFNTGWSIPSMACGLNGFAEHAWINDGGARAEAMGWDREIEPPRHGKLKRALLLGQVMGDAMIQTQVVNYPLWMRATADKLTGEGWTVTFRPHPVMVRRGMEHAYGNLGRLTGRSDLRADLTESDLAVALNSNALVAAYLLGVDTRYYNGGTMLSPLVFERLNWALPWEPRRDWLNRLAWAQWTLDELGDGTWFKHHEPIMRRIVQEGEIRPWCQQRIT